MNTNNTDSKNNIYLHSREYYRKQRNKKRGIFIEDNDPIFKRVRFLSEHQRIETMRGLHEYNILVLRDEKCEDEIYEHIGRSRGNMVRHSIEDIVKMKKEQI